MITQLIGTNIKGLTFAQDIDPLTLFVGANGAGKSARSQALILALMGYIPGSGKTNADILENYGSGDTLIVGVKIKDTLFERGYVRKDGKVSQGFKVGGKAAKEGEFNIMLGAHGAPKAIDIGAFMALSDQKKIDAVFDLYPPETDISKIVQDIDTTKANINNLTARAKSTEDAAARLTTARAAVQLPVGTLADIHSQVVETEANLARVRQDLKDAEAEDLRLKTIAEEKLKSDKALDVAKEAAALDARRKLLQEQAAQMKAAEPVKDTIIPGPIRTIGQDAGPFPSPVYEKPVERLGIDDPVLSIKAILDALNSAGCSACVARLVAIRELRKYVNKEAA
jgi:hypothetical protein